MTTPLSQAESQSIEELFSRDPLTLTDAEVDRIVTYYRDLRAKWAEGEKLKSLSRSAKSIPKTTKGDALAAQLGLDLGEIII